MEITHIDGRTVNTDELADVDAILMEESAKLHKLFAKYNRQLTLVGEMKGGKDGRGSCCFFHLGQPEDSPEKMQENFDKYMSRLSWFVSGFSRGHYTIAQIMSPPSKD